MKAPISSKYSPDWPRCRRTSQAMHDGTIARVMFQKVGSSLFSWESNNAYESAAGSNLISLIKAYFDLGNGNSPTDSSDVRQNDAGVCYVSVDQFGKVLVHHVHVNCNRIVFSIIIIQ